MLRTQGLQVCQIGQALIRRERSRRLLPFRPKGSRHRRCSCRGNTYDRDCVGNLWENFGNSDMNIGFSCESTVLELGVKREDTSWINT